MCIVNRNSRKGEWVGSNKVIMCHLVLVIRDMAIYSILVRNIISSTVLYHLSMSSSMDRILFISVIAFLIVIHICKSI